MTDCLAPTAAAKWASAPNDVIPRYERYYQRVLEAGSASAASIRASRHEVARLIAVLLPASARHL